MPLPHLAGTLRVLEVLEVYPISVKPIPRAHARVEVQKVQKVQQFLVTHIYCHHPILPIHRPQCWLSPATTKRKYGNLQLSVICGVYVQLFTEL